MRMSKRVFLAVFVAVAVANLVGFAAFIQAREPLTSQEWAFLEDQRPQGSDDGLEIHIVHDGRNVALARRPVGGWESVLVKGLMLFNLPAYAAATLAFHALQSAPGGTSRLHSDAATGVFLAACLAEWVTIALLAAVRRRTVVSPHSEPHGAA